MRVLSRLAKKFPVIFPVIGNFILLLALLTKAAAECCQATNAKAPLGLDTRGDEYNCASFVLWAEL
jgi:hypothetical protein